MTQIIVAVVVAHFSLGAVTRVLDMRIFRSRAPPCRAAGSIGRGMRRAERVGIRFPRRGNRTGRRPGAACGAVTAGQSKSCVDRPGADIPDQPVARVIEDRVQRTSARHPSRSQMAAGDRDRADRLRAQFVGNLAQLLVQKLRRSTGPHPVQQRCVHGHSCQSCPPLIPAPQSFSSAPQFRFGFGPQFRRATTKRPPNALSSARAVAEAVEMPGRLAGQHVGPADGTRATPSTATIVAFPAT